jgi:hypothetical protein
MISRTTFSTCRRTRSGSSASATLAQRGIRGNGHMLMIELNSVQIADVVNEWLEQTLGFAACPPKLTSLSAATGMVHGNNYLFRY